MSGTSEETFFGSSLFRYFLNDYFLQADEWGGPKPSPEEVAGTIFVDLLEL